MVPKTITNEELYKITKQQPWSVTCKERRLKLFGHTCRLPIDAPARQAIQEAIKPINRPVGGQINTLIKTISKDLKCVKTSVQDAMDKAQNKGNFRALVERVMSYTKTPQKEDRAASRSDDLNASR